MVLGRIVSQNKMSTEASGTPTGTQGGAPTSTPEATSTPTTTATTTNATVIPSVQETNTVPPVTTENNVQGKESTEKTPEPEQKDMFNEMDVESWKTIPPEEQMAIVRSLDEKVRSVKEFQERMQQEEQKTRQDAADSALESVADMVRAMNENQATPEEIEAFEKAVVAPLKQFIESGPTTNQLLEEATKTRMLSVHGAKGIRGAIQNRKIIEEKEKELKSLHEAKQFKRNWESIGPTRTSRFTSLKTDRYAPYPERTESTANTTTTSQTSSSSSTSAPSSSTTTKSDDVMARYFGY